MIIVSAHLVARSLAQSFENLLAAQHLADGEGTEPVEVDTTLALAPTTLVTVWPLANVAIESHGGKIASRHNIHGVAIGNQVGEGQVARVGVVHQFAEQHRE